jgi:peptide-methionine (S)-S-oxide reductase
MNIRNLQIGICAAAGSVLAVTVLPPAFAAPTPPKVTTATAVFAGGCFWGMEAVFEHLKGVSEVVSGYSGGDQSTAHYDIVGSGNTGHAESIKVSYDPAQISYSQLLKVYFLVAHDPTQLNRQNPDWGTQYRSAIFFASPDQKRHAETIITDLNKSHLFSSPIVTQVVPFKGFYAAEGYHQDFIARNPNYPYVVVNDLPKIEQLRKKFPTLYKQ